MADISLCDVTVQDVKDANVRIRPTARVTPVLTDDEFDREHGRKFYFKAESMQRTGAFKIRGVTNVIRKLQENKIDIPGLVTHSSGNHGRALAYTARALGVPCVIICPSTVSETKLKCIRDLGAEILPCQPTLQSSYHGKVGNKAPSRPRGGGGGVPCFPITDKKEENRMAVVQQVVENKGYVYIPTCENFDIIAGQGTMGLELLEQVPDIDAILVPASGGGMAAGICAAVKGLKPSVKVFIVEPEGKDLQKCLESEQRLWTEDGKFLDTVADGMRMQQLGMKPWSILVKLAEKKVFTMSDEQILHGMSYAFHKMKIVVEPSAGAPIAAAMSRDLKKMDPDIKHVGVILCGGNVDTETFFQQLKSL